MIIEVQYLQVPCNGESYDSERHTPHIPIEIPWEDSHWCHANLDSGACGKSGSIHAKKVEHIRYWRAAENMPGRTRLNASRWELDQGVYERVSTVVIGTRREHV